MTKEEYENLCREIWHHNKLYYIDHQPEISDQEFDFLFKQLEQIEQKHPEWITSSSPTQRVGESMTQGFHTVTHRIPMLSLANTYSKEELGDFIKRVTKLVGTQGVSFCSELKMDGIAVSVTYEKGKFTRGVTRGDGKQGDDISVNLRTIKSLPLELHGKDIPEYLELRGEVFMPHKVFASLNEIRAKSQEPLWANPRNAAAGSLKLLDTKESARRGLEIVFYSIAEVAPMHLTSQFQIHAMIKKWGLPSLSKIAHCTNLDDIWAFAESVKELRSSLPYDIDGVVVKLDNLSDQQKLGITGKNPRWAVAYKFAAEQAVTKITDITLQVGRTGVMTPVAELVPIFLAGSTIARATLHNEEEVQRKDIRIGDTVIIEKGGDVIPKVVEVDFEARAPHTHPWSMPLNCPSCGSLLQRIPDEVAVRCPNARGCPEQKLRHLIYVAGKFAFDIENLGEKIMEQLVEKGFVKNPSDIFRLTEEQLYQLEGFKKKSVDNLLASIEKARHVSLPRFIMALGIKHVGTGMAELLASKAGDLDALKKMSAEELLSIEGVGEKVAQSILDYFANEEHLKEIEQLLAFGVAPQKVTVISFGGHAFEDKTFVLTGSLENYTRQTAAALIKERGGKVTGSVTKKTDFLLAGSDPGSKYSKALELGIAILTEAEFTALL